MSTLNHEIYKPEVYELRLERYGDSRLIVSGHKYNDIRKVGNELVKKLLKGDGLVITTPAGHELCRWM
jgi:hypothetical protein